MTIGLSLGAPPQGRVGRKLYQIARSRGNGNWEGLGVRSTSASSEVGGPARTQPHMSG
jgi:hypothetical protein